MKRIEDQIRILADHAAEVSATETAVGASAAEGVRRPRRRWVFAGINLVLVVGITAFLLVQIGRSGDVPTAATPPPSAGSPVTDEPPGSAAIPSLESRLVRDDATGRWAVHAGSGDGVVEGNAVISLDGELIGLLGSPGPGRTEVHVVGEPGFELDAFVAVPDTDAPDLSGRTFVEGTVRSGDAGQVYFEVAPDSDDVESLPGLLAASAGGPDSPVHAKLPIGLIGSKVDDATAVYLIDVPEPVEGPVSILLVGGTAD